MCVRGIEFASFKDFSIGYTIMFKEWRVMNNVDRGGVIVLFIL
jgi:hypothetical protein